MFGMSVRLAAAMAAAEMGLQPEDVLKSAERMGVDFDSFGAPRSKQEILDAHTASLRCSKQQLSSAFTVHNSYSGDTKPVEEFPRVPAFAALMPVACADLQLQATHRCATQAARVGSHCAEAPWQAGPTTRLTMAQLAAAAAAAIEDVRSSTVT